MGRLQCVSLAGPRQKDDRSVAKKNQQRLDQQGAGGKAKYAKQQDDAKENDEGFPHKWREVHEIQQGQDARSSHWHRQAWIRRFLIPAHPEQKVKQHHISKNQDGSAYYRLCRDRAKKYSAAIRMQIATEQTAAIRKRMNRSALRPTCSVFSS